MWFDEYIHVKIQNFPSLLRVFFCPFEKFSVIISSNIYIFYFSPLPLELQLCVYWTFGYCSLRFLRFSQSLFCLLFGLDISITLSSSSLVLSSAISNMSLSPSSELSSFSFILVSSRISILNVSFHLSIESS